MSKPFEWGERAREAAEDALSDGHRRIGFHYDCCFQDGTHGSLDAAAREQFADEAEQRAFREAVGRLCAYLSPHTFPPDSYVGRDCSAVRAALAAGGGLLA